MTSTSRAGDQPAGELIGAQQVGELPGDLRRRGRLIDAGPQLGRLVEALAHPRLLLPRLRQRRRDGDRDALPQRTRVLIGELDPDGGGTVAQL